MKIRWYIAASVALFVLRHALFVASFAGVEHDSGWYLGIARNLAQRGIYASYTNTMVEDGVGPQPSIHQRFSVQDAEGFSHFPALSVGPGYVLPQALFMKVFGYGLWQYRAVPMVGFAVLLTLLFALAYRFGGITGLVVFQCWLWMLPQLTVTFSFESLSEHLAFLYLLAGFLLVLKRRPALAGLAVSAALQTKLIMLVPAAALAVLAAVEGYEEKAAWRTWAKRWARFAAGVFLPWLAFEAYRYFWLTGHFGVEAWHAINRDFELHFGSANGDGGFFPHWRDVLWRARVWWDAGLYLHGLGWAAFLALPFLRRGERDRQWDLLYGSSAIFFLWFLWRSNGWGRYVWPALIVGMLLLSAAIGANLRPGRRWPASVAASLLLLVLAVPFETKATARFFLDESTIALWHRTREEREVNAFPPIPVFPVVEQKALIEAFRREVRAADRVYYEGGLLVAEIPPLVDKVFYPLPRYAAGKGRGFLIVGPYQRASLAIVPERRTASLVTEACTRTVFESPSYLLCELR